MTPEQQQAEDLRTHREYNLNAAFPMTFAQYEYLRDKWRERGGEFYGPNVETGKMPESRLIPFLQKVFLPFACDPPAKPKGDDK